MFISEVARLKSVNKHHSVTPDQRFAKQCQCGSWAVFLFRIFSSYLLAPQYHFYSYSRTSVPSRPSYNIFYLSIFLLASWITIKIYIKNENFRYIQYSVGFPPIVYPLNVFLVPFVYMYVYIPMI